MNKYKAVSLVLAIALIASLARLVIVEKTEPQQEKSRSELVLENILSRKSVRSYTDQPISREQIDTLLRAAMAAPTAIDLRLWRFVVVNDRSALDSLRTHLPYAKMLQEAQAAIVVCGDTAVLDPRGKTSAFWQQDCAAATENLLLQAEAMGLGAVWTGCYPAQERVDAVQKALSLPANIVPLSVIPIGYPKGDAKPKNKWNAENVHYGKW